MAPSARSYLDQVLALGRRTFTRQDAEAVLERSSSATYLALRRLVQQGHLAMPRRGFYLIVEPQHRAVGAPPPTSWIADLMAFHDCPYYVGLLSAAALHGAAHQQPQEFQVVSNKVLRAITVGRVRIRFFYRRTMRLAVTEETKTTGGMIHVSTPEMTAYDLVRYRDAASIDHVATVIDELAERMDGARLVAVAKRNHETPVVQRLGYLLDQTRHAELADGLARFMAKRRLKTVPLEPGSPELGRARDPKWHLLVNTIIEVEA